MTWFPHVNRDINGKRLYSTEHIQAITKHVNQKNYRIASKAEDMSEDTTLQTAAMQEGVLHKFLYDRDIIGLENLRYQSLSDSTIKQLLQIAIEDYQCQDSVFKKIIEIVHEKICSPIQISDVAALQDPTRRKKTH